MKGSSIVMWTAAAVLVAWTVGGYNRLVRLRNEIGRQFALVEGQLRARDALLRQWLQALRPLHDDSSPALDATQAAAAQLLAACDAVRPRPSAAGPMASLRLAEDTLTQARQRLDAALAARAEPTGTLAVPVLGEEIAAIDATLGFIRGQFNAAIDDYNRAVGQFPTWLLALVFRFRVAGMF